MTTDPDSPRVLARLRSEADAQFLADRMRSLGIKAIVCGSPLMSAQPELPAEIEILVRQGDLERAQAVRAELAATNPRFQ
jgi:hypothetical protein